ncbi:MAG: M48 family metallopeptidase [Candidatus Wildermuthbacteria bacterium]|nr:M48 family metallopeptidase [Candidatus Wildermuthbacteria bacterium]
MQRHIKVKNRKIRYAVKISRKAKNLRLDAYYDGRFILTIPRGVRQRAVTAFIREKAQWMLTQLRFFKQFKGGVFFKNDPRLYLKYKEEARELIRRRLAHYSGRYDLPFGQVRIKNHRTMWGSCSERGNLNFSYKIILLPKRIADYIIVHELCHIRQFNHSKKFWGLVAEEIPEYETIEKELKTKY